MINESELNTKINNLVNAGSIERSIVLGAADISGGCVVTGDISCFKNISGDDSMILPLDECESYLASLEDV